MALTIGDANDVQTLIHYLYGLPNGVGELPAPTVVEDAARRLADRSSKSLMAGLSSRDLLTRPLPGPEPAGAPGHAPGCPGGPDFAGHYQSCRCVCHQPPLA